MLRRALCLVAAPIRAVAGTQQELKSCVLGLDEDAQFTSIYLDSTREQ